MARPRPLPASLLAVAASLALIVSAAPSALAASDKVTLGLRLDTTYMSVVIATTNATLNITGFVWDNETLAPVQGATIRVGLATLDETVGSGVTEADGRFRAQVTAPLQVGVNVLVVKAEEVGHNRTSLPVNVTVNARYPEGPGFEGLAVGAALVAAAVGGAIGGPRKRLKLR